MSEGRLRILFFFFSFKVWPEVLQQHRRGGLAVGLRARVRVRVRHGERGVLPQAAQDLPVPAAGHRGVRDVVRRHVVLRDAQAAAEDRVHGAQVPAAPGVPVGAAPR